MTHNPIQNGDDAAVAVYSTRISLTAGQAAEILENNEIVYRIDYPNGYGTEPIVLLVPRDLADKASTALEKWEYLRKMAGIISIMPTSIKPRESFVAQMLSFIVFLFNVFIPMLFVLRNFAVIFGALLIVIAIWILYCCVPAFIYVRRLKSLGYEWPTVGDAHAILQACGRKAHAIPPAADVELIPGFMRNPECLILFLNAFHNYRQNAASNRR